MNNFGIDSLREAVMIDCEKGENCFNENGCDHEFYRHIPETNPKMLEMGKTTSCIKVSKCTHKYCDKFKFVIDRAEAYAKATGLDRDKILKVWEENRNYWYMNYYQDSKFPDITKSNIPLIDFEKYKAELIQKHGKNHEDWKFKCCKCNNIASVKEYIDENVDDPINTAITNCIGRYNKNKGCDWTIGGLFQLHKIMILLDGLPLPVFEIADKPHEYYSTNEDGEFIDYKGYRYWYKKKHAEHKKDICLATENPYKYCNGFYLYSSKDPGNGIAFVVTKTNNPNNNWMDN